MIDFRRITLFCLKKRLSRHKMTVFSKHLGGSWPLCPPGYANATKQIIRKYSAFKGAPKETVMCRYFAFKGAPNSNCNLKVICIQRGAHQPLKYVSTLLLNFTEGAPKRNWNV